MKHTLLETEVIYRSISIVLKPYFKKKIGQLNVFPLIGPKIKIFLKLAPMEQLFPISKNYKVFRTEFIDFYKICH